jgi:hypothetical protein
MNKISKALQLTVFLFGLSACGLIIVDPPVPAPNPSNPTNPSEPTGPAIPTLPTNFLATAGEKEVDLTWDTGNASTTEGYLVIRSTSPITFVPVDGESYTLADIVDTDQVVAYVGPLTSFTDQPLVPMQIYYYALFAYTDDNYYSASLVDSDTPFNLWAQEAYIKPSNMDIADAFGFPLDIDGDVIVAAARGEDGNQTTVTNGDTASATNTLGFAGAAYVFRRTAGTWVQEAYLKAANANANDQFGVVSISGDTIVVGVNLEDSNQTIITNGPGASGNNGLSASGAAYVFRRTMDLWAPEAYIKAPNVGANDNFGATVAISGDTIVVGAYDEDSNQTTITNAATASTDNTAGGSGAAYVFKRTGVNWAQEAYIKPPNTGAGDNFGNSVEIDGDTIVVGAWLEDSNQTTITNAATASADNTAGGSGAVYVFKRTGVNWAQEAYLKASNAGAGDNFGVAVAISGDTIVVGAYLEDSNQSGVTNGSTASADNSTADAGAAYVFKRTGVNWAQEAYLKASNPGGTDYFGAYVAIHGNLIAVSSFTEDSNQATISNDATGSADNSAMNSGAVYIFRRTGVNWMQEAYVKAENVDAGDQFGVNVAVSGDTVVTSANNEDSNQNTITTNASADDSFNAAGAVYVYR